METASEPSRPDRGTGRPRDAATSDHDRSGPRWPNRDAFRGDPARSKWITRAIVWWGTMLVRNYMRVEVRGQAFPDKDPVLVVQNHNNGLCDAHFLMSSTPRPLRILVKYKLLKVPVIGWMLKQMDAVPMYRKKDGVDTRQNASSFEAIDRALVEGAVIALFPEGESLNAIGLRELRSGIGRMAISAYEAGGPGMGLKIVPVGVSYENRDRYRSSASALIGEPIDVEEVLNRKTTGEGRARLNAVMDATRVGLEALILHAENEDEYAAAVALERIAPTSAEADASETAPLAIRRQDALRRLRNEPTEGADRRRALICDLGTRLESARLTGDDIFGPRPSAAGLVKPLIVDVPIFLVSMIAWCVPMLVSVFIARYRRTPDKQTTLRALFAHGGFLLWIPIVLAVSFLAWNWVGLVAAVLLFAFAIPTFSRTLDRLVEARRILALRAVLRDQASARGLRDGIASIRESYGYPSVTA